MTRFVQTNSLQRIPSVNGLKNDVSFAYSCYNYTDFKELYDEIEMCVVMPNYGS